MMRPVLAIAAGLLCGLWGMRTSDALLREAREVRRWADLLTHLSLLIRQAALSLPEALRAAAIMPDQPDRLLLAVADHLEANRLSTPADAFSAHCSCCAGHDTLLRMSARLGHGDAQSRSLACQQAARELSLRADGAEKRAATDARLWRSLGWTGGACLTLLLL